MASSGLLSALTNQQWEELKGLSRESLAKSLMKSLMEYVQTVPLGASAQAVSEKQNDPPKKPSRRARMRQRRKEKAHIESIALTVSSKRPVEPDDNGLREPEAKKSKVSHGDGNLETSNVGASDTNDPKSTGRPAMTVSHQQKRQYYALGYAMVWNQEM